MDSCFFDRGLSLASRSTTQRVRFPGITPKALPRGQNLSGELPSGTSRWSFGDMLTNIPINEPTRGTGAVYGKYTGKIRRQDDDDVQDDGVLPERRMVSKVQNAFSNAFPPVHPPLNLTHLPVPPSLSIDVDLLQYR